MKRVLNVFIDTALVGELIEANNIWSFKYAEKWLEKNDGHALSPRIPLSQKLQTDGSTTRPIQWFFDNLLPEEKARELLANDVGKPIDDAFALLEVAGAESAGAITLLPSDQEMIQGEAHRLENDEISKRIQALPRIPLNRSERKRMSLAGAQHKMLVVYENGQLFEPSGQLPSTHIVKPEHTSPDVYYQTPRNEWFVMSLAKHCGLTVPDVDVLYVPEPVYLIKRFDRLGEYPHQRRVHTLDGCQLLNIPHTFKYTNSNVAYLKKLIDMTRTRAKTMLDIFRWACFNAFVGNGDAHLKNLSFFLHKDFVVMTPHYDLLSTAIYEDVGKHMNHELSQPMGEARFLSDLTTKNVLLFAEELGIPAKLATLELNKMMQGIEGKAESLIELVKNKPAYKGKPGEERMLNEIFYNCIREMVSRLSK